MHELGIVSGVLDAVKNSVSANHADKVYAVNLSVGEETEVIKDCMDFAWEALTPGTVCEGAKLNVNMVKPKSVCLACGKEFEHDRFHNDCPECGSYETQLIAGRELNIDSIDVDIPDDASDVGEAASDASGKAEGVASQATSAETEDAKAAAPSSDDAAVSKGASAASKAADSDALSGSGSDDDAMQAFADSLNAAYDAAVEEAEDSEGSKGSRGSAHPEDA